MVRVSKLQKEIIAILEGGTEDGHWVPAWVLLSDLDAYPCSLHRALTKLLERGAVVRRKSFDDSIDKRWYYDYCLTSLAAVADMFEQDRTAECEKTTMDEKIAGFVKGFAMQTEQEIAKLREKHGFNPK